MYKRQETTCGKQNLHDGRGLTAHLPHADTAGHRAQQFVTADKVNAFTQRRPEWRVLFARRLAHLYAAKNR